MVSEEQLNGVAEQLTQQGCGEETVAQLRRNFPDIHFTYCMDDDICSGKPCYSAEQFDLYYIDSREHCLGLTGSAELATGLVVAERVED